jgi:hypothetical protein
MNDLHAQLDRAARFDAEYGHNLASHLPMALTALHRLGASAAQRDAFAERYVQRHALHGAIAIERWSWGDPWRERLGDPAAWPVYRGLFHEWIEQEGVSDTLVQVLPWLMPGVGAAAFHAMLRLGYALAAQHGSEVADSLAYWACRWFDCGSAKVGAVAGDPVEVLNGLRVRTPPRDLIAERMDLAARSRTFRAAMKHWTVNAESTLPAIARAAAEHYARSGNFTLLHLLTSAQAMHSVLPWLDADDRDRAVACYAAAGAAAWITTVEQALPAAPDLDWPAVVARALDSAARPDEEHVIKCVDAAREMNRIDPDPCWLAAAARAVA